METPANSRMVPADMKSAKYSTACMSMTFSAWRARLTMSRRCSSGPGHTPPAADDDAASPSAVDGGVWISMAVWKMPLISSIMSWTVTHLHA